VQIIDNKALLITTKKYDQIINLIPKSKLIDQRGDVGRVLVHWGFDEARLLRNLKIRNVPSPILKNYAWPGVYTPFDHQKTTAAFLAGQARCFCLSDAGTGKTSAAAWAADYLMNVRQIKRVLVVCPVSIMDTAWKADLFRTVMHRTVGIATGSREARRRIIEGDYEFVIINFDGVKVVNEELEKAAFDLIIVDECSAVQNVSTDRWKSLANLIKPTTRLWMMTGTPAAQSPVHAYGLAKLVNPSGVPRFFGAFRDMVMYKATQFKWLPKANAAETVYKVLQPAIRFTKEECLDLPDLLYTTREVPLTKQQIHYYEIMRKNLVAAIGGAEVTAINAAGLLNKLLQVACIAYNTEVLTDAGWLPIQAVTHEHKVWDGCEWVQQKGAVLQGVKPVVSIAGVFMTSDHKVLTDHGWKTANELLVASSTGFGLNWATVRLPDGFTTCFKPKKGYAASVLGVPMCVWNRNNQTEPIPAEQKQNVSAKLWVLPRESDTRYGRHPTPCYMGKSETTLCERKRQGLGELRRSWYHHVRTMATKFFSFLGRYEGRLCATPHIRTYRREWPIFTRELPLGYTGGTSEQQTRDYLVGHTEGSDDTIRSVQNIQSETCDPLCETVPIQMAFRESADYTGPVRVYDLIDCGPRSRFVVRGQNGTPLIVHNCGSAYTVNRDVIDFDISNRFNELVDVIESTSQKVIVFVAFRHVLERLEKDLTAKGISTVSIHGSVGSSIRADYIRRFQTEQDPKVILLQPQAAAHGITLTRADTVVWWVPVPSAELYMQGNARAHRAGQRHPVTVVRLQGSSVERRIYGLLDGKLDLHQGLVDLFHQEVSA
jgi:hypothetical protein